LNPLYRLLRPAFFTRPAPPAPKRVALILPCCIGDVVMATPTLQALRRAYPNAHITWCVGSWSKAAIEMHPALNTVIDTGAAALPVKSWGGFWRFVEQLRSCYFDLAVSLVRSPLMSLALWLAGIPHRAGLDSDGRGFGYSVRAPIDPLAERHEADIYLDVPRALGLDVSGLWASCPPTPNDLRAAHAALAAHGLADRPVVLVNPAGGQNPGMVMDSKRYPAASMAFLAERTAERLQATVMVVAGPNDGALAAQLQAHLSTPAPALVGVLTLRQIAALASLSRLYLGNDTGLTHLAAAAGAPTVMVMGPTSPKRYAPYTPDSLALWKPVALARAGVAAGNTPDWDWARDGIAPTEALAQILAWLAR
jgi:heptosyltransferase-2/heptosyltransferase-3